MDMGNSWIGARTGILKFGCTLWQPYKMCATNEPAVIENVYSYNGTLFH